MAHRLVDKLSVIIGHCGLVSEDVEPGSECARRLQQIQNVAAEVAKELSVHQCRISEAVRSMVGQETSSRLSEGCRTESRPPSA
jgi:hypothetical protein